MAIGEIDLIEGVHNTNATTTTLHTNYGCDQGHPVAGAQPLPMTGVWEDLGGNVSGTNCFIHAYGGHDNMGCPIHAPRDGNSMGAGFNHGGGGVYAFLWTD